MQDLLAASFWIGMGCRVLPAMPSARTAAIQLLAIGGMPIAYQSVALTMRAVKGDGHHEKFLILRTWLAFIIYHILLIRTTTRSFTVSEHLLDLERQSACRGKEERENW
jgi:hypothetical protein